MAVNQVSMNGEELINLTADTVSEETLLEGETAHDASGNIITGKFVPYNPNLLINFDFSINQRGLTEYSGKNYAYTVDGWKIGSTDKLVVNDGNSVTIEKVSDGTHVFVNSCDALTSANSAGKTVTFSFFVVEYSGSVRYNIAIQTQTSAITLFVDFIDRTGVISCTVTLPTDTDFIHVDVQPAVPLNMGDYAIIKRAKLEYGSIQTLARQDTNGNWVFNDPPPDKAIESLKCQRYLQFHTSGDIDPVDLRPTMRITPTVTQMDDGRWMYNAEL